LIIRTNAIHIKFLRHIATSRLQYAIFVLAACDPLIDNDLPHMRCCIQGGPRAKKTAFEHLPICVL
jgi:hypothetical protein